MPRELERRLSAEAIRHGFKKGSKRWRQYVFGTMRKLGWKPKKDR